MCNRARKEPQCPDITQSRFVYTKQPYRTPRRRGSYARDLVCIMDVRTGSHNKRNIHTLVINKSINKIHPLVQYTLTLAFMFLSC